MGDAGPGVGSLLRGVTGLFTCPVPGTPILAAVPSPRGVRCQQACCFRCRGKNPDANAPASSAVAVLPSHGAGLLNADFVPFGKRDLGDWSLMPGP